MIFFFLNKKLEKLKEKFSYAVIVFGFSITYM